VRVLIVLTDDRGKTFEGEALLVPQHRGIGRKRQRTTPEKASQPIAVGALDFTLPARAFIRRYARKMTGPQKFTALLAWLAKGKAEVSIDFQRIRRDWDRMTEPMGGKFNPAYTTRAVDNGWVESPKKGTYRLRSGWNQIFSG